MIMNMTFRQNALRSAESIIGKACGSSSSVIRYKVHTLDQGTSAMASYVVIAFFCI